MHDHPASRSPDLLVGFQTGDDAGVFRLPGSAGGLGLVQTVDFFTPIVDEPYDWGRIAAANALSDLYAMAATPLTALQLVGWPRDELPFDALAEVVRGGADVMALAGCTVVGGHSIDDREPTYGFAVTGLVEPGTQVTNAAVRPGDRLVLTKPLGTGIVSTAIKREACPPEVRDAAVALMAELNDGAARAMTAVGVRAATDVTGFGLLGHLREMLLSSSLAATVHFDDVPILDGAPALLDAGYYPGGSVRNLRAVMPALVGAVDERRVRLLADAQTSGGLLISVPPGDVDVLVARLLDEGVATTAVIGHAHEGEPGAVSIV